jgi:hypothetical protein
MVRSRLARRARLNPRFRLLAAPCRSGSTALLYCLAQHPEVLAYYQTVKSGLRAGRGADHRLFTLRASTPPDRFIVDKETLGPHTPAEASLRLFPSEEAVAVARPVFLFRDPVRTWNGWASQGWLRFDLFELAYASAFQAYLHARAVAGPAVRGLTYEHLIREPLPALTALCEHWGLTYHPRMLDWDQSLAARGQIHGGKDFVRSLDEGSFAVVQQTRTLQPIDRPTVIADEDVRRIAAGPLPRMYEELTRRTLTDR